MSGPESFSVVTENPSDRGPEGFTRWQGLLGLVLGWTLGPLVALLNQEFIYQADMWACGRNAAASMQLIPLLCLIVCIGVGVTAYRNWKAIGAGVEEEADDVPTRTRFMSIGGVVISAFAGLVIIAQWAAIFVFDPCMRA